MERTLAILKPDAVERSLIGPIVAKAEGVGLKVVAMRMIHLTLNQARGFYAVHKERPFYDSLCSYLSSGPIVVMVLEGEGAIPKWRELMGATDPAKAAQGTIRKEHALNIEANSVHGSDAPETAQTEISFLFPQMALVG